MNLRKWVNEHQKQVAIGAGVVLFIVLLIIFWPRGQNVVVPTGGEYFFDLNTNEPFEAPFDAVSPIDAPSGGIGVRAVYLSCGGCGSRYLGWLERYTPKARELYLKIVEKNATSERKISPQMAVSASMPQGLELRSADGGEWIPLKSAKGQEVIRTAQAKCGGKPPRTCQPSD